MSSKFPHLFEPIILGKTLYKNRIFYSPTGYKEQPVDEAACYYERKAMGGAASVCVGDATVAADGIARSNQLRLDLQSTVPALEQISSAIVRHGAVLRDRDRTQRQLLSLLTSAESREALRAPSA
jgi:2,4-dienoyl-CoA reductase-like NADH-dependent reductase (Old Yellow Enzyme family)